jgi:methylmalonyl-CoA/ethylmalonyl-CoA epimerase
MKFHHIGIACKNIDDEIANIANINKVIAKSPTVFDEEQNSELALVTLADGTHIEFISGKQVESLVTKNISYYHLCFEVDDIDSEIVRLTEEGAFLISGPKPTILFNGRKAAFLIVSYGIIELLNSK